MTLRVLSQDPFKDPIETLIDDLKGLHRPQIGASMASPSELEREAVAFLMNFASVVDACVVDLGRKLSERVPGGFSPKQLEMFTDQLSGALEGNATFVLEDTADGLREDFCSRRRVM